MTASALAPSPRAARADEPTVAPPIDDATRKGREAYARGLEYTKAQRWDDALTAFREAERHRDAPLVQYGIGFCLRALGYYVAARERFARALAAGEGLTPTEREEARALFGELDRMLVRVHVTLEPATAALTVDGRPLKPGDDGGHEAMLARVEPPGEGRSPGKGRFLLVVEGGPHVFVASRPGYRDAVAKRNYPAGEGATLALDLDTLPAHVSVTATPVRGIVRVDGREVGVTPIEFERPAGKYRVEVVQDKHEPYEQLVELGAGQHLALPVKLPPRVLAKQWWFWTSILTGAAALTVGVTYAATHHPAPADYYRGNANWLVPAAARW